MGKKMVLFENNLIIANTDNIMVVDTSLHETEALKIPIITNLEENLEYKSTTRRCYFGTTYIGVSLDNKYLAVATESKVLTLWSTNNWKVIKRVFLLKRPVGVVFSHDSSKVLVADKSGDVYSFCVSDNDTQQIKIVEQEKSISLNQECYYPDEEAGPEPLLGHLSMLLDMTMARDGKYLVTCDRDEKIRVSCYPNCYNIHTFCLGHEEFVSHVGLIPNSEELLSCSGDGTLRLWNYLSGLCLDVIDTWPEVERYYSKIAKINSVTCEGEEIERRKLAAIIKFDLFPLSENVIVIVILINRLPFLLFYTLKNKKFNYFSSFEVNLLPIDVIFLQSSELLVVCDSENSSVNPLKLLKITNEYQNSIMEINSHPILNFGEKYKDELKVDSSHMSDFELLYKQRYDNVAEYKKRKEERIGLVTDVSKKE